MEKSRNSFAVRFCVKEESLTEDLDNFDFLEIASGEKNFELIYDDADLFTFCDIF